MGALNKLLKKVKTVERGLSDNIFLKDILEERETEIVELNTQEQLYEKGENALGISIADYEPYSDYTLDLKAIKGQPTDRVTLRDEGDFHRSFGLELLDDRVQFYASDWKTIELIKRYGEIMGLNEQNLKYITKELVQPDMMKIIQKILIQ